MEGDAIRYEFKEIDVELTKFSDQINNFLKCEVYEELKSNSLPNSLSLDLSM